MNRSAKTVTNPAFVWFFIVGCLALLFVVGACAWIIDFYSPTRPPGSVENPPLYPGAQLVEKAANGTEYKVITFQTSRKAADVLNFYDKVLRDDGWYRCEGASDFGLSCLPVPNGIVLQWSQASIDGPTGLGYRYTVIATDTVKVQGLAAARIEIIRFNPASINRYPTQHPTTRP